MQVIAHNLISQFSDRQLNITKKGKEKNTEKLASGYRINRSADDAAGLQISEKLRWQTRGLNRASNNIQDGISLIQVADGALNETHAVLQRMRELSVQAANDTNTDMDREALQKEIEALTKEVDRIAHETSFNEDIYPLNKGMNLLPDSIKQVNGSAIAGPDFYYNGNLLNVGTQFSFTALYLGELEQDEITKLDGSAYMIDRLNGQTYHHDSFWSLSLNDLKVEDSTGRIYYESKYDVAGYTNKVYLLDYHTDELMIHRVPDDEALWKRQESVFINYNNFLIATEKSNIWIQMGAKSEQGMFVSLVDATARGVGITEPSLDITSYAKAGVSISRLDEAIDKVSSYRSSFGAQQNRLEYAKFVDDNTAENTQAAESRLRDADMSEEMVQYSKHNILEQAGQAMLSQANQNTQGILTLLQ